MTDINANLEIDEITIAAAAQQCLESFETCLAQASAIHPREFSRVEDQTARFSDWTGGNGVFAPGRASLDHRLRYDLEVHSVALGLLDSLNYRIRECSDVMDGHGKNPESDFSDLTKALEQSCSDIALQIRYLNKLSNMIRRSTSKEQQALKMKNFQATNEDKNIERTLLNIFKLHIGDKFPRASEIIQQRLAEAMIFRRKRVLYWRYRQEAAAKLPRTNCIMPQPPVSSAQVDPLQEDKQKSRAAEPVVAPSEIQSATTLQPIALSDPETLSFPAAPRANAKQKYDQLKKERLAAHQIVLDKLDKASMIDSRFNRQNLRVIAENDLKITLEADLQALGEITCPYCLEALPAIEVFDQRKWRKHVKNDLDPYVCLFEECNEAGELYKHSENWLRHMHKHNQIWPCRGHRELDPFLTREDYMQHLREAHNFKLGEEKLRILANRNARKARKLFTSCPLCSKSEVEVGGRLESHIAGHLRSLALKSLPPYEDDIENDVGSDRDGCGGSQLSGVRTTDDPSIDGNSSTDGSDDELSRLSETEEMDFVNDAPHELDSGHADAWNALMGDWISNKPTLQQLQQTSDKDPIFHLAQGKAKESHSLPQTPPQQQQQPMSSESWEQIPPLVEADTLASNVSQTSLWYSIRGRSKHDRYDLGPLMPGLVTGSSDVPGVTEQGMDENVSDPKDKEAATQLVRT